jgi:hypothetical protein
MSRKNRATIAAAITPLVMMAGAEAAAAVSKPLTPLSRTDQPCSGSVSLNMDPGSKVVTGGVGGTCNPGRGLAVYITVTRPNGTTVSGGQAFPALQNARVSALAAANAGAAVPGYYRACGTIAATRFPNNIAATNCVSAKFK